MDLQSIPLRQELIEIALKWQDKFGIAPSITSTLSELDASLLVGCPLDDYIRCMKDRSAVSKGYDFVFQGKKYQVKANRPSGKKGSVVTLVNGANNHDFDYLIWILYDNKYEIQEAWIWSVDDYIKTFQNSKKIRPKVLRTGIRLK